ncbi:MAG TPA: hypothetical protein VIR29_03030 [Anseongella sp.]
MVTSFDHLRLHPAVLRFFRLHFRFLSDGHIQFRYLGESGEDEQEIFSLTCRCVPCTSALWIACPVYAQAVKHCFLFNSAAEAISFSHYCTRHISGSQDKAFVSLGLLPREEQVERIRNMYPNAKLHTVFGSDLPGRVMDCKIALWSKRRDARFTYDREYIQVAIEGRLHPIPAQEFSLNRFERTTGLRAGIRTHKSKNSFSSFLEMLINNASA